MNDQQKIDDAVAQRMNELRERLDQEKETRMEIAAIRTGMDSALADAWMWDKVPEDFSDEQIIAVFTFLSGADPFTRPPFGQEFIEDFHRRFMPELKENDMQRLQSVVMKTNERLMKMQAPLTEPSDVPLIEIVTVPPEQEGGEWILIAAPMEIDKNYEVSMPQNLKCGITLTLQVSSPDDTLSGIFNAPAIRMLPGEAAKPLTLAYQPSSDGEKMVMVGGFITINGKPVEHIVKAQSFHVGPEPLMLDDGWNFRFPPGMQF